MTTGVLLVNLGTPDSPSVRDVRRYLREFLSDPYVIDIPGPLRWLLLNLVILPRRPRASALAYAKIWGPEGSPLRFHGEALRDAVAGELGGEFGVALGMRYGRPSIREALEGLVAQRPEHLVVLPLFPQHSAAATGSALAKVEEELRRLPGAPPARVLGAFYDDPGFVAAWAGVARPHLQGFDAERVLMSFHGLPERQVRATDPTGAHCLARPDCCDAIVAANRDCYRAQCFATARQLTRALDLDPQRVDVCFQSRLGATPWIRPYTDRLLPELADRGVKRVAVLCPAFVADCLETLEEIGIRAREQWQALGGAELRLVPSLNAEPIWARAVAEMIRGGQ